MASITVRNLGPNYDPLFGNGLGNFLTDQAAVAQIIGTTLRLNQGEWFENTNMGTPLFQKILGHAPTLQAVSLVLRQRILSVPFVTGIASFSVSYSPATQGIAFSAVVSTAFGAVTVSNIPQVSQG